MTLKVVSLGLKKELLALKFFLCYTLNIPYKISPLSQKINFSLISIKHTSYLLFIFIKFYVFSVSSCKPINVRKPEKLRNPLAEE